RFVVEPLPPPPPPPQASSRDIAAPLASPIAPALSRKLRRLMRPLRILRIISSISVRCAENMIIPFQKSHLSVAIIPRGSRYLYPGRYDWLLKIHAEIEAFRL